MRNDVFVVTSFTGRAEDSRCDPPTGLIGFGLKFIDQVFSHCTDRGFIDHSPITLKFNKLANYSLSGLIDQ